MTNFHLNTTVVAIFPNVCLWRRLFIEPPSFSRRVYVVAIWPSFLYDSFGKIWATCEIFFCKWFTAPPGKKFPVRLWLQSLHKACKTDFLCTLNLLRMVYLQNLQNLQNVDFLLKGFCILRSVTRIMVKTYNCSCNRNMYVSLVMQQRL